MKNVAAAEGIDGENGSSLPKAKRSRNSIRRDTPPRRSSIYRGVTRHRWTGRYEAHLWDKYCWNQSQSKKGRQVYLGAYDAEEAAAHAYDLAALKYWGQETVLNFPVTTYTKEVEEMKDLSKEEYVGSLRRKSSGFSRGVSKYRGVARHHHNGRWEARIGRVFGNKYLYLGTYGTQEEAAAAYDMAAIEYRGLNAVTNFDLSRYIKWLRPGTESGTATSPADKELNLLPSIDISKISNSIHEHEVQEQEQNHTENKDRPVVSSKLVEQPQPPTTAQTRNGSGPVSATLGLLLQSSKIKEMLERSTMVDTSGTSCPDRAGLDYSQSKQADTSTYSEDMESFFQGSDYILNQNHEEYLQSLLCPSNNNMMMNMLQGNGVPNSYDQMQLQNICSNTDLMDHESLIDLMSSTTTNSSGSSVIPFGMDVGSSSSSMN